MSTKSWLRSIFSRARTNPGKRTKHKPLFQPLQLLTLEDRITPATIMVLNTNDSGADSLRAAIDAANLTLADDTIVFNSGVTGTITLQSSLPNIVTAATAGTLTIIEPGASSLTISGDNNDTNRNFNIFTIDSGG